jgi:hypothetical protein
MKNLFLIYFIIFSASLYAQTLPTINAKGGKGQSVDWLPIKEEEHEGFFFNECAGIVEIVSASSELKPQGTKTYSVENLRDEDPMTAWVEGKPGYGIGESFSVRALTINTIYNGYQSTPLNWKNNSRVKKLKVYKDNKAICFLLLTDEMGEQVFTLPIKKDEEFHVFKFEIVEVYKGLKWDDVAVSHVDYVEKCH